MQAFKFWLPKFLYYGALTYFTYLMVLITLQYIPIKLDAAFLNVKFDVIHHSYYQIAFFSHVFTSIFVLIAGILQFSSFIRINFAQIHRWIGKAYVLLVLLVSSPSGLIMAFHANGGFWAKISFVLQSILWFSFTFIAWQYALRKNWNEHKAFMIRSFALTLSAISLRLFKWMIASTLALPPMDTYRIVAWLGWIANLVIVEIYLFRKAKEK